MDIKISSKICAQVWLISEWLNKVLIASYSVHSVTMDNKKLCCLQT